MIFALSLTHSPTHPYTHPHTHTHLIGCPSNSKSSPSCNTARSVRFTVSTGASLTAVRRTNELEAPHVVMTGW